MAVKGIGCTDLRAAVAALRIEYVQYPIPQGDPSREGSDPCFWCGGENAPPPAPGGEQQSHRFGSEGCCGWCGGS